MSIIDYTDIISDNILDSNHNIITLKILIIINKPKPSKQQKRKYFLQKNCSKEILENYSNQTTQSFQQITLQINSITNQNQLNNTQKKL